MRRSDTGGVVTINPKWKVMIWPKEEEEEEEKDELSSRWG